MPNPSGILPDIHDLPRGWTDVQEPGKYRLERRQDDALFGYVVGPHSWKKYLFPPLVTLATADRTDSGWSMNVSTEPVRKYAFVGVRACELAALPHGFVVEVGSDRGGALLAKIPVREVTANELTAADDARSHAVRGIQRQLNTDGIRDLLLTNLEHPRWDEVATRCLSCTNCTMVCPTCFCSSVSEVSDLQGDHVERERHWDSCFNLDFSNMNGGVVRNSIRSRYRQWLTHKLAPWNSPKSFRQRPRIRSRSKTTCARIYPRSSRSPMIASPTSASAWYATTIRASVVRRIF